MTLFLASAVPAVAVALLGWFVAVWARSSAKGVSPPIKDRYAGWEK